MSETSSRGDFERLTALPQEWVWTTLGEVSSDPQYGWTTKAVEDGSLHILRTTDITSGHIDWSTVPYCLDEPPVKKKYLLNDGDVVISRAGSVGFSHLIKNPPDAVFASYLIRFKPRINEQFFAYFLKSPPFWQAISEKSVGIALQNVNASKLRQIIMPLPPLPEQHRIVAKIEELFTQLDAGVASLKKVQAQLKRYRQAVLKAAFEGRLTQELREEHKVEIEPADVLLKCIEKDRNDLGKKSDIKNKNNRIENLGMLPNGWVWTTVNQILQPNRICSYGVLQPGDDLNEGILFVRVGDINDGKIALEGMKKISPSISAQYPRTLLEGDEVLITLVGAIGRTAVVPKSIAGANVARAVGVIPVSKRLNPKWVEFWFRYPPKVAEMTSKAHEVARKTLNLEDVRAAYVAIPPKDEQDIAVNEIERLFSIADEVETTISTGLHQTETLRRSILKRAFEGKLVPQDSTDEPASVLLERIKAEKAHHTAEVKKGKKVQSPSPKRKIKNAH